MLQSQSCPRRRIGVITALFVAVSALCARSSIRAEAPANSTETQRRSATRLSIDSFDTVLAHYVAQDADADAEEVEEGPSDEETQSNDDEESNEEESKEDDKPASDNGRDEALINRGRDFFETSCTLCHDAERSTSKRKSQSAWLATVRRMAAKEDADVPSNQHAAIAAYLASLNPANDASAKDADKAGADADVADVPEPPFTINGTLSPVYRGTEPDLENKGFFPDVWVGAEWRSQDNPVSGQVMACASCHGTDSGLGVELVEAAVTVDLCQLLTGCPADKRSSPLTAKLKAGRFIVPFGATSARVHPGSLRTVSLPLMFNMGRRVGPLGPQQPVLPMPYSDEGVVAHFSREIDCDWNATFDVYGVNGLQVGGPAEFMFSRSYQDNNSNVAVGGRATIGNNRLQLGGSIASGELQPDGLELQPYKLAGGDVGYRYDDLFRVNYEYAIREEDPFPGARHLAYGNVIETEVLIWDDPKISAVARYDTLEHRGTFGDLSTERFTYGVNWVLRGGSLAILNHEHWIFDDGSHANIFGARWTVAF